MPLPQQTFSTFEQLVNYINTFIVPNGDAEITGGIHNNVANGLSTWLQNAALNSGLVRIYNSGGVIDVDHNIDAFTTVLPTSVSWPDNFVKEFYFINTLPTAIPLADGFSYSNLLFEVKTEIPPTFVLHIARASNNSWVQVNNNPSSLARNGLSLSGGYNVLGQDVGQSGDPAILLSNREIPLGGFNINYTGAGSIVVKKTNADDFLTITNTTLEIFNPDVFTSRTTLRSDIVQIHVNAAIGGDAFFQASNFGVINRSALTLTTNFRNTAPDFFHSAIFMDDFSINTYADGMKIGTVNLATQPFTLDVTNKTLIIDGVTGAFPGQMKLSPSDGVTDVSFINIIDPSETFELRLPVTSPTGTVKFSANNSGFRFSRTSQGIFIMNTLDAYFQPFNQDSSKIGYVSAGKQVLDGVGLSPIGVNESNSLTTNFSYPTGPTFTYAMPAGVKGMFFDFIFAAETTPGTEATFLMSTGEIIAKKGAKGTSGGYARNSNLAGGESVRLTCIATPDGVNANWILQVLDGSSFANWTVN